MTLKVGQIQRPPKPARGQHGQDGQHRRDAQGRDEAPREEDLGGQG